VTEILFLGTDGSEGIPVYGCDCPSCTLARRDPRYARTPTSILVTAGEDALLVDVGTMRPAQHLAMNPHLRLHAVLLTHWHHDHYAGLYSLRWSKRPFQLLAPPGGDPEITGKPIGISRILALQPFQQLALGPFTVETIPLRHTVPTLGYLITLPGGRRMLTLFDTKLLDDEAIDHVRGKADVAIVDATYAPGVARDDHNNVDEAITLGKSVEASQTILTHIAHHNLPPTLLEAYAAKRGARLAYENQKITL